MNPDREEKVRQIIIPLEHFFIEDLQQANSDYEIQEEENGD